MTSLTVNNVEELEQKILIVKIPDTKTKIPRTFVVEGEFRDIVKKYQALRSPMCASNRFFQNFQNGRCLNQCIGINKFGAMPKQIANFLGLDEPERYTGHSFRRTSATLLADSGANLTTIKRHGGWKSSSVAETYIENSIENKRNISASIANSVNIRSKPPCTSTITSTSSSQPSTSNIQDMTPHIIPQPPNKNDNKPQHITATTEPSFPQEPQAAPTADKENENLSQVSQRIRLSGKNITFNIQNCTNVHFYLNKDTLL